MSDIKNKLAVKLKKYPGAVALMIPREDVDTIITTIESLQVDLQECEHATVMWKRQSEEQELLVIKRDKIIESQKEEIERARQAAKHWQDRYDGTSSKIESLQKEKQLQHDAISEAIAKWETMQMDDDPANVIESILSALKIGHYVAFQERESRE